MAAHGLAVFEGRVIHGARPPATEAEIRHVEARLAGPVPEGLRRLWAVCLGGNVDYDVSAEFDGRTFSLSFTSLFAPDDGGYHDLPGWIDHELELAGETAEETGEAWDGRLSALPFGGFEYLTRLYVWVGPDERYGRVYVWQQGLPPAWGFRLHEDAVAPLADDVPALFRLLRLDVDPREPSDGFPAGREVLDAIDVMRAEDPSTAGLADRLEQLVLSARVDWRSALEDGTIVGDALRRRLALEHAAQTGDVALLQRLSAIGCDLDAPVGGGEAPIAMAMAATRFDAVRALLAIGVAPTTAGAFGSAEAPADLLEALFSAGGSTTSYAAIEAAAAGRFDNARLIVARLCRDDPGAGRELRRAMLSRADSDETTGQRVRDGLTFSNVSAEDWQAKATNLRRFASELASN